MMDDIGTRIVLYLPAIFLFPILPAQASIKNISWPFFHPIWSSTKITEFDNVKFPKVYHQEMVFGVNSLRLTVAASFQETSPFHLSPFHFLPTSLKSWAHISDNIAGAVCGRQ